MMNYMHILPAWMLVWALFWILSWSSSLISYLGIGVLALYITDWLHKAISNCIPRHVMKDTKDKAVFITGCDSGFGLKVALELNRLGFKVFAGCLNPDGVGASQLKNSSEKILIVKIDVTKELDVVNAHQFVEENLQENEQLWAVVNNAGVGAYTEIEFCPLEEYRKLLDVNALGLIRVTKTFLPLLRKSQGGRIVIVASLAGRHTFPGFSAYSMSKHAAVSFADALRLEMNKWNLTVHTIEPTLYKTPISNVTSMKNALDKYWQSSTEEVKKSYGEEYFEGCKSAVQHHMARAKPVEKIQEVINDMIDAVAGVSPKSRYVPNVITQIRSRILSGIPTDIKDSLFLKDLPKTPPAYIAKRLPPLQDPRAQTGRIRGPRGSLLKRMFSMPVTQKPPLTPSPSIPTIEEESKFKF